MQGHDYQYADLIILALVAGFLILRLRSVLGRRTGEEAPPPDASPFQPKQPPVQPPVPPAGSSAPAARGQVIDFPATVRPVVPVDPSNPESVIRSIDPGFDTEHFLAGARKAFEMILAAFAKGDLTPVRAILGDSVARNFDAAIAERRRRGERLDAEVGGFRGITLARAEATAGELRITVRFVSEQTIVVRDGAGQIVEGAPDRSEVVNDEWTFSRKTGSRDPNWHLVATSGA